MAASLGSQVVAEFLGTFLLVFTVGCNVLSNNPVWGGVSIASVLMVMIYAFGKISGGNFNPAVSLALGIAKALGCDNGKPWKEVGIFSVVQIAAGILAGFCYYALFDKAFHLAPVHHHWMGAFSCEFLYTFVLCFVVLNVAAVQISKAQVSNSYYGLAIGFVVIAGAYGAGAVSGGCFNPAVAIGIDVIGGSRLSLGWSMFYIIFELLGGALAAGLFVVIRPEEIGRKKNELRSKLLSEFLGTFVLVLTVGLNVLGSSQAGAFSIAASLTCMIYALGDVSGANFNPAVTVAIVCCKGFAGTSPKEVILYILAQISGGMIAGFTYSGIYDFKSFPLGPASGFGWDDVAVAEIVFTFLLCLVVLCVAVSKVTSVPDFFGLAIGSCITVGGFAIGSISGGSLNPAVSFGIAASNVLSPLYSYSGLLKQFGTALTYSLFEFIGAGAAAAVLKITHVVADEEKGRMKSAVPVSSQLVAEFVGTFLLVFTVGCNILSKTPVWPGVSIASTLMVSIYALGKISGANFNPAVSLTLGITKALGGKNRAGEPLGMSWKEVALYIVVQIVAGILAGFTYYAIFDVAFHLGPAKGFSWMSAAACEFWYTFMLCFVVLSVVATENSYFGLAIGFVVVAGAYGAGAVSGGCFNPAVAIGIDVIGGAHLGVGWSMVYIVFEILGAILASALFWVVRKDCFGSPGPAKRIPKVVSELLGTYMLVLTVGLNVLANSPAGAFSIAACLMSMIYALADVSGANFNPAVTIAILLCESNPKAAAKDSALYIVAQIVGGILASLTYMSIYQGKSFPLGPGNGFGWAEASIAEFVFTCVLCLVVLCAAVKSPTKESIGPMFGLAIGSCVTVGGFAIGKISGGSLNPAVSIGIGTSRLLHGGLQRATIYSIVEILGAVAAAGIVKVTHNPSETNKSASLLPQSLRK